jgi:sugar transferase (PEP-CTERM/EpsH1 system associated)
MKILWLSHNIPYPPKGGVLQRNYNLLRQLTAHHRVFLLAFNQRALLRTAADVDAAVVALRRHCEEVQVLPLPGDRNAWSKASLVVRSAFTRKPYTVNWSRSADMERLVHAAVESFQPDLIHYDTIGLAEYHLSSPLIPQVLNHHNVESAMMGRRCRRERNVFKRLYFRQEAAKLSRYERAWCPRFDTNITVSGEDAAALAQAVPGLRTDVIPNGVDISYFTPGPEEEEEEARLVFAGGMGWYPNRDAMLYFAEEIWPLLKQSRPAVQMTVIGRRPHARLVNLSRRDPNFVLTGYVDDVRPHLARAAVYVCPIRDGGGTRLKILDALAMGKPIVATSLAIEGTKCVPGRHALIADRPEEFATRVVQVLDDRELRRALSREARALAEEEYDWTFIGRRMNQLYSGLASARDRGASSDPDPS